MSNVSRSLCIAVWRRERARTGGRAQLWTCRCGEILISERICVHTRVRGGIRLRRCEGIHPRVGFGSSVQIVRFLAGRSRVRSGWGYDADAVVDRGEGL
jgi:hypothetical protein